MSLTAPASPLANPPTPAYAKAPATAVDAFSSKPLAPLPELCAGYG